MIQHFFVNIKTFSDDETCDIDNMKLDIEHFKQAVNVDFTQSRDINLNEQAKQQ